MELHRVYFNLDLVVKYLVQSAPIAKCVMYIEPPPALSLLMRTCAALWNVLIEWTLFNGAKQQKAI